MSACYKCGLHFVGETEIWTLW